MCNNKCPIVARYTSLHFRGSRTSPAPRTRHAQRPGQGMPESIEEHVKSWTLVCPIKVTSFWLLAVLTTIFAKIYHWTAGSWYPGCCSLHSLLEPYCCIWTKFGICIQVKFGSTFTMMTSTCSLLCIITYYYVLQRIFTRTSKLVKLGMISNDCCQIELGGAQSLSSPVQLHWFSSQNSPIIENNWQSLVFQYFADAPPSQTQQPPPSQQFSAPAGRPCPWQSRAAMQERALLLPREGRWQSLALQNHPHPATPT